jgi:plasmid maintenance system antidote protein VapI
MLLDAAGVQVTALQLQRLLDRAGLSQRGAAKALEINERTMRKYVSGDSKIPKTVELALLYLATQSSGLVEVKP